MGMPFESSHRSRGLQLTASATTKTRSGAACPPPTRPSHLRYQSRWRVQVRRVVASMQRAQLAAAHFERGGARRGVALQPFAAPQVSGSVVAAAVLEADRNFLLARPGGRAHARNKQAHAPPCGHAGRERGRQVGRQQQRTLYLAAGKQSLTGCPGGGRPLRQAPGGHASPRANPCLLRSRTTGRLGRADGCGPARASLVLDPGQSLVRRSRPKLPLTHALASASWRLCRVDAASA